MEKNLKIIECPRDAMQGLHDFIDTKLKAAYINLLLQVGFDTIDFGSFVSPKAIPQLRDTQEVLSMLNLNTDTKLLAIVANLKGVERAILHQEITYLGFPFSISETFQQRNTHSSIEQSLQTIDQLLEQVDRSGQTAVVYLSMAFGNPYGDEWNLEIVQQHAQRLIDRGVKILSLADTTGVSDPEKIKAIVPRLIAEFPQVEIGLHLHSLAATRLEKIDAAYQSGCRRFDSAIKGYGGCPMASDELTGNLATEDLLAYFSDRNIALPIQQPQWQQALSLAATLFPG